MAIEEFENELRKLIGSPSMLRPFICEGSPLDCDILLVGFNPKTPMPADYWSFWREGYGFDKKAFEAAYEKSRVSAGEKTSSNTRGVMRHFANGASGCKIVEANLYGKATNDERSLAKADRDLRPFLFLVRTLKPKVIVPFGRFARKEFQKIEVQAHVEPVHHFSRRWSFPNAEKFGTKLAAIARGAGRS